MGENGGDDGVETQEWRRELSGTPMEMLMRFPMGPFPDNPSPRVPSLDPGGEPCGSGGYYYILCVTEFYIKYAIKSRTNRGTNIKQQPFKTKNKKYKWRGGGSGMI